MAITGLKVQLKDTVLGTAKQSNGNCMIVYGVATAFTDDAVFTNGLGLIASADDARQNTQISKDAHLLAMIEKFYAVAGAGAKLWIYAGKTAAKDDFVTANKEAIKRAIITTGAATFDNRPRIVGYVSSAEDTAPTGTTGYPAALNTLIAGIQSISDDLFKDGYRIVNVVAPNVDADILSVVSKAAASTDFGTLAPVAPSVGVVATTSVTDASGKPLKDVGEVLGLCASVGIQESIGSVARSSVSAQAYFNSLSAKTAVEVGTLTTALFEALGAKQVIFHRTRVQRSGRYYNDAATCNEATKALSEIQYVRVANVVCDDAEYYFQGIINTNVPLDSNGNAQSSYLGAIEDEFYNTYCSPRIASGQVSDIRVTVNGDKFIDKRTLTVTIEILPSPTCREIYVYTYYVTQIA